MLRLFLLIFGLSLTASLHAAGGGGDEPPDPYLPLKPDFVVNIGEPSSDGRSYVKAEVTIRFNDPSIREKAEAHEPWLRHEIVMLLSGQPVERMRSPDGQAELRDEARAVLEERLGQEMPEVVDSFKNDGGNRSDAEGDKAEKTDNSGSKQEELRMIREVLFPNFIVQVR